MGRCGATKGRVEVSFSDGDGVLLRMLTHPRAANATMQIQRCVLKLQEALLLSAEEAVSRLESDEKFTQLTQSLALLGAGSQEESHVERSLKARVRILVDSQRLGDLISPSIPWKNAQEGLEKVKRYRKVLSDWLQSQSEEREILIQDVLD